MSENLEQLHNRIVYLAKEHRRTEAKLIDQLQKADQMRLYLHRGHSSLFRYVCDELGFSESVAYNLITVARKAKEIPAIQEEIRKGELSVSKIRKVCPVIDKTNHRKWIQAAKTSTSRELETRVAAESNNHNPRASLKAVAKDYSRFSLDISDASREKLNRLRDILSSKKGVDCSLPDVLNFALESALEKHDPIRKAERAKERYQKLKRKEIKPETKKETSSSATCPGTGLTKTRKPLPREIVHKLHVRDRGRCTYVSSEGKRCKATRWLHFHHILAIARGGKDVLENITTLCSSHHRLVHENQNGGTNGNNTDQQYSLKYYSLPG